MITICKVCEKKIMRGEKFRHCERCKEDFCRDCKSQLNIKQQEMQRSFLMLTKQKRFRPVSCWEKFLDKFGLFKPYDLDDQMETVNDQENFPLVEMLIFDEKNFFYQIFNIFVSFISLVSSYYYLYLASFRMLPHKVNLEIKLHISEAIESVFLVHMIL